MQVNLACVHFTAKQLRVQTNKTLESQIQKKICRVLRYSWI
jgi:hypothetical protein